MDRLDKLEVFYHERRVGVMALYQNRLAAFEYDNDWLAEGFSISPFSLPLEKRVFMPKIDPFEGLFGVFADSLPDGWGRLLVDRLMKKNGINPYELGSLDRLAIVGSSGMGALTYRPIIPIEKKMDTKSLDEIALECEQVLTSQTYDNLDYLFTKGGSSGGARPKILTTVANEDWIIKFPSSQDSKDIGKQEYDYALCAKKCGIEVENIKLFPSDYTKGYFGTRRFDRVASDRIHMVSAAGLLETSHRIPNLDYDILMKLTLQLTKKKPFLNNAKEQHWVLAPAYDLTYSNSLGGEHATTVNGNGQNPGLDDMLEVAKKIGLSTTKARKIALNIKECVFESLQEYISQ